MDRAFWNFLTASILTTVAAQIAVSTDAAIVSHLMGPHAMAAVNMAMPVLTAFLSLNSLLGVGASLLAAKAIGSGDTLGASRVFTAALYSVLAVGVATTVVSYACCEQISHIVCADAAIRPMVLSYLKVTCLGVTVLVLSGMMNMMVQSDGRPRLVTCGVVAGAVTNVVLDMVFIKALDMGVAGSAWATVINYGVTVCVTASHLRTKKCSYRVVRLSKAVWKALAGNLQQGAPLMIANVLLSVILLLVNKMVDGVLGSDGAYMVAVCIQLLLITFVVLNGVLDAVFAIGGSLMGEHDIEGLRLLFRRAMKFSCVVLVPFTLLVLVVPGAVAELFGADDPALREQLCRVLRIFALILLPFAATVLLRGVYQVLGHLALSVGVAVGQVGAIVLTVFALTQAAPPDMLWWGFPLSAAVVLIAQLGVTWRQARGTGASVFTLIPQPDIAHRFSATVSKGQKAQALSAVRLWLQQARCPGGAIADACRFLQVAVTDSATVTDVCASVADDGVVAIVVKDVVATAAAPATKRAFGVNVNTWKSRV